MDYVQKNKELNDTLSSSLSELRQVIQIVESELIDMGVPKDVWVVYQGTKDYMDREVLIGESSELIGLIKIDSKYRLCYGTTYFSFQYGEEEPIEWKPLVDCTIISRIEAIQKIDLLKAALIKEKKDLIDQISKAMNVAKKGLLQRGEAK